MTGGVQHPDEETHKSVRRGGVQTMSLKLMQDDSLIPESANDMSSCKARHQRKGGKEVFVRCLLAIQNTEADTPREQTVCTELPQANHGFFKLDQGCACPV
jgi:hypothetical protein